MSNREVERKIRIPLNLRKATLSRVQSYSRVFECVHV